MLNKVLLIGRLSRNPEVRYLPSGTQVTSFTIAVNRNFKDKSGKWQEETYFFDVETFGDLAGRLGSAINKGDQVLIEGSLRQDRWEDKKGEKRSKIKIVADRVSTISKTNSKATSEEIDTDAIESDVESDEDVPF